MQTDHVDIAHPTDGELHITVRPGRSVRRILWRAARAGVAWGLLIGGGFNLFMSITLLDGRHGNEGISFAELLDQQVTWLLPMAAILLAALFTGTFLYNLWQQRRLNYHGDLRIADDTLTLRRRGFAGGRTDLSVPLHAVDFVQTTEITYSGAASHVSPDRNHEVTLVTRDDMLVLACGIDEESADALVETIERSLTPDAP